MQNHNQLIEIIAAHRDGKAWEQLRGNGNWHEPIDQRLENLCAAAAFYPVRIKPAPVKRLVLASELPMPCFVQKNASKSTHAYSMVQAMHSEMGLFVVAFGGPKWMTISELHKDNCQYSHDGKTWKSFEVEA